MRLLVTGAAGFIGSHIARHFAERHPDWEILTIERLNYAAALDRLADLRGRIGVVLHDLRAPLTDQVIRWLGEVDWVIHAAAETHVDKSLVDPRPFVESNVLGTLHLLEWARLGPRLPRMFFYVSTDEVYGPAPPGTDHDEGFPHRPSNPYSASKAAAEDLCHAWNRSMGVPVVVTNTMNNIGEGQHPEKYVPKIIRALLRGDIITVHGSPDLPGSRKYLYARDHAEAIEFLMARGERGERYNVVGAEEVNNLELVRRIERIVNRVALETPGFVSVGSRGREIVTLMPDRPLEARVKFVDFHSTRPGHDLRYSLDGSKLADLGWTPPTQLDEALEKIVRWTLSNPAWL